MQARLDNVRDLLSHIKHIKKINQFVAVLGQELCFPISVNLRLSFALNIFLAPPKWTVKPPAKKIEIVIATNGTLDCQVTASPPADITWYKNGALLDAKE